MATNYNLANIRTLLTEGVSDAQLRDFYFHTPGFRPVRYELAELGDQAARVDYLLEYAQRKALLPLLLAWAKDQNPAKYVQHQPYEPLLPSPSSSSFVSSSPSHPLRVFLCHASADKPAVHDLYQRLNSEGFIQPWLDEEELLPGQDWDTEIRKAVRTSDVVLVCLSPHSITKAGYVQKEIKFALDVADEQPEGTIFLIPLRLEACDVPERLSKWHWANLFEARGYERLLRALKLRANAVGVTVASPPIPLVIPSASEESPQSPVILDHLWPAVAPPLPEKLPANRETPNEVRSDMEAAAVIPSVSVESPKTPSYGATLATPPGPLPAWQLQNRSKTPSDQITLTTPFVLELVHVPAGVFLMGSDPAKDKNARPDEQPQHQVYLSEFYIGKYPVTNEQYAVFVKATRHKAPDPWEKGKIPAGKENYPVDYVSWEDAMAFCQWLSQASGRHFHLPTEAEWEKAARGTDGRIYPWGNQWDRSKLNSREGGPGDTTPVGRYSPGGDSPYSVVDTSGNVWEWCSTGWQDKVYPSKVQDEWAEAYLDKAGVLPVLRGGSWVDYQDYARCAIRLSRVNPGHSDDLSGFRVVSPIM